MYEQNSKWQLTMKIQQIVFYILCFHQDWLFWGGPTAKQLLINLTLKLVLEITFLPTLSHIHYLTDIRPYIHCIIQIVYSLHKLSYIIQYSLHHKWTQILGFFIHLVLLVTGISICHKDNIDCVIQIIYLLLTYIITHHPIFATS